MSVEGRIDVHESDPAFQDVALCPQSLKDVQAIADGEEILASQLRRMDEIGRRDIAGELAALLKDFA